jgi:hypothetical protein
MNLAQEPAVIEWFGMLKAEGMTRDEIVRASQEKTHSWPGGDMRLSNGSAVAIIAVLKDRERRPIVGELKKPPKRPKRGGRRMREIRERKKQGGVSKLIDVQYRIVQLTNQLESIEIEDYELDDVTQEALKGIYDDLSELQTWMDMALASVERRMEDANLITKIKHLREGTTGRTEEEIRTARRLADRLQRRLEAKLTSVG